MTRRAFVLASFVGLAFGIATPTKADPIREMTALARAGLMHHAILDFDLARARTLAGQDRQASGPLLLERTRLLIHESNYDDASRMIGPSDEMADKEGAELAGIAFGSARAMAGTVTVAEDAGEVVVGLQDEEDRSLIPYLRDTATRVRATLLKDLGVELPKPIRIELVRDQFTLAAMTGLPKEAAQTTGTVAIAKWGRVTMVSPRATSRGYGWLDTLAHEMTHLALSKGTLDKAPLWMQEGVAKREETRWRDPEPLDHTPSSDAIAAAGFARGIARPFDKLGPSIAMLPSAEEAMVAFAGVSSFMRFWMDAVGQDALAQLVLRVRSITRSEDVNRCFTDVSGIDFATWQQRWRQHLVDTHLPAPDDVFPNPERAAAQKKLSQHVRLAELLQERGHSEESVLYFGRAHTAMPTEASLRCGLALAMMRTGGRSSAELLVANPSEITTRHGRYWSVRGLFQAQSLVSEPSFTWALELDPLDAGVACEEKIAPELPSDALRSALCETARRGQRWADSK